jgi:hypothetical protein
MEIEPFTVCGAQRTGYMVKNLAGDILHCFTDERDLLRWQASYLRPDDVAPTMRHDPNGDTPELRPLREPEPVQGVVRRLFGGGQ